MIVVRRVIRGKSQALFNALALAAGLGTVGYGAYYALNARDKEFRHRHRDFMRRNPEIQAGLMTAMNPAVAAGYYGGKIFSRRRKTKNGKVVIENVRKRK